MEITELDKELSSYIIFRRALTDAFENGVSETRLSDSTKPSTFVFPFPSATPDSDFTFVYKATGKEDYNQACRNIGFNGSVTERNNILREYKKYLKLPNIGMYSHNHDKAWGRDYEREIKPVLELMGIQ